MGSETANNDLENDRNVSANEEESQHGHGCEILTTEVGPKKYQKIARMYDRTGLSTKCTLVKTGFKNLPTGTEAKFRPFVDALI